MRWDAQDSYVLHLANIKAREARAPLSFSEADAGCRSGAGRERRSWGRTERNAYHFTLSMECSFHIKQSKEIKFAVRDPGSTDGKLRRDRHSTAQHTMMRLHFKHFFLIIYNKMN